VAAAVDGRVLEGVEAVGKHLLLRFEGGIVVRSHLRMSGRWRVEPVGAPAWRGKPWLVLRASGWEATQWGGPELELGDRRTGALGPDLVAAGTDVGDVLRAVREADPRRLLGDALLDQRIVAGIGNMWLSESLWSARVSPWRALGDVRDAELRAVLEAAQRGMRSSVTGNRPARSVYRRARRPCPRCGSPIVARGLGDANRTAYSCPSCQPGGPPGRSEGFRPSAA
jgi:endonuclease-8